MKLVEERNGRGLLTVGEECVGRIGYRFNRYQAMTSGGLPVPGLHRIEGQIAIDELPDSLALAADMRLDLVLEDGRRLRLTLLDSSGRVLEEGHGPGKCGCC